MSMDAQKKLIRELISYESETEWFEFKRNWFRPDELGEYISALANAAAAEGKKYAYFVWGIDDETHEITGTDFQFDQDLKNEPLKHYLARNLNPSINIRFSELVMNGKRLVLLTIPASESVPTSYAGERYIRIGSSKEKLRKYPEKEAFLFDVLKHGLPTIVNTPAEYQDLTFEQLHISEKTGRGVPKITEIYGRESYTFNDDSIVVTLPFKWINVMSDKSGNKSGNKMGNNPGDQDTARRLTPSQINILDEIRNNPNITKKQLQEKLGLGKSTVDLGIKALRENGIIERIGSNKTGYWKITE